MCLINPNIIQQIRVHAPVAPVLISNYILICTKAKRVCVFCYSIHATRIQVNTSHTTTSYIHLNRDRPLIHRAEGDQQTRSVQSALNICNGVHVFSVSVVLRCVNFREQYTRCLCLIIRKSKQIPVCVSAV